MMEPHSKVPRRYTFTRQHFSLVAVGWGGVLLVAGLLYVGIIQGVLSLFVFSLMAFIAYWTPKGLLGNQRLKDSFITEKTFNTLLNVFWFTSLFISLNFLLLTLWTLSIGEFDAAYFVFSCAFVPLGSTLAVSQLFDI